MMKNIIWRFFCVIQNLFLKNQYLYITEDHESETFVVHAFEV